MTQSDYYALIETLNHYCYEYYVLNKPSITDYEFDQQYLALQAIEKQHPNWIHKNSPTQRVGVPITDELSRVQHSSPMLSLSNAFNEQDIENFLTRLSKRYPLDHSMVTVEPKIDGCAVSIRYEYGHLVLGATRGNGQIGETITHTIKTIRSLPLYIQTNAPAIEFRGEVYIHTHRFKSLASTFSNPRNAASGTLRQLDPSIAAKRGLDIYIYSTINSNHETHSESLQWIQSLGLPTIPYNICHATSTDIMAAISAIQTTKNQNDFCIDGAVIKLNNKTAYSTIGTTAKAPKWAIAYKFPEEQVSTKIISVRVQVGRTGVMTPVANVRPVSVSGIIIKRASLHNFDEIHRLGVRIGDTVIIKRAGDVIPKIIGVLSSNPNHQVIAPPKKCPSCQSSLIKTDVAYRCINNECPAQLTERVAHFCSKNAMNIHGMGTAIINQLLEKKLIASVSDIYRLTADQLLTLDRSGERFSNHLLHAIEASKQVSLSQFIYALGIPHVGAVTADILAKKFQSIACLLSCNQTELENIHHIGPKIIETLLCHQKNPLFIKLVKTLLENGVTPTHAFIPTKGLLNGKHILITGTLSQSRSTIESIIKNHGGIVAKTVTRTLNYLVVGEKPGSKLSKATELNDAKKASIQIIHEDELLNLLPIK